MCNRITRCCNQCEYRYDGGLKCPKCGEDVYNIGEMWDNMNDSDWMFPNGSDED